MEKLTTCLWFNGNAEEAVNFYAAIFKDTTIKHVARYGDHGPGAKGSVMVITFDMNGQAFMALNGGPQFAFTPAISLMVNCDTQAAIDHYWDKLLDGGKAMQCGWLTDKYGLTWQIVPAQLGQWMQNPAKAGKVMAAVMKMVKFDIAELERAAA